jgi:hypothetical protein
LNEAAMSVFFPQHPVIRRVFVFCALLLVYLAYLPGISGALYYDDYSNLQKLAEITDWASVREFIFGGGAGPLGRPLSLASFALQAAEWPIHAAALLHVNVLIHVANTLLLFLLGHRILNLRDATQTTLNFRVALGAAFLWSVLPLLVSTTLITVQRMTGLAALFGLLGLLGFVYGYSLTQRRPLPGFLIQMACLGLGTLLSLFSKENGALIPCFALVIEYVLLRHCAYPPTYRRLLRGALLLCLLIILFYISPLRQAWFVVDNFRGFSPWQRLNTEVVIVWEYLRDAFLPQRPVHYSPFRDAQDIITDSLLPPIATAAWLGLLALAVFLERAKGFAWLLFGLLWFWTGHLLESSTPLLELVFEHRNYLALYGFCLMLSWSAWHAQGNLARLAPALFMAYTAMLLIITVAMTVLWGNPTEAAQRWADAHPRSARAALHATFLELGPPTAVSDATEELLDHQKMERALFVLDRTGKVCPDCLSVKFQSLVYACRVSPDGDITTRLENIRSWARKGDMSYAVVDAFFPLHDLVQLNACGTLTHAHLLDVAEAVLLNPKSQATFHKKRLHFIAAMVAQSMGDDKKLEWHLAEGERTDPEAMPVLQFQVHHALERGRIEEALQAIFRRRQFTHLLDNPANVALLDDLDRLVQDAKTKPRP